MELNTYLNYGGNCQEAFRFYEQHLGAKLIFMMTHDQAPNATNVPPEFAKKVLHASLSIGGTQLLASDVPSDRFEPMRSVYLSLSVDSSAEAERIHGLLADGGNVFMPMQETFFAYRFSMLRDRFGTSWMIIHPRPRPNA
jgi:PhnB protein